ncbi:endonuclease/exonuclease/phosphatase family protein [Streptomyces aidingensis]|uniref:Metal-dependent hydrolase, endonuclease/exonuclease/phosphatase family n=1 Tax=Streptomyces aidingensis TaxID=910347 RepID=A0A1I1TT55_9ACTN|nr:endonuclease/exonuclease/phosphatase family protein [Streptomyces aidingensis]SFD61555.1 Metal-dependent hydrolase, endonuclease/exonuclease/phosphatase family [Streptomyces aidingensis]
MTTVLRFGSWNLGNGGIDPDGEETRRKNQITIAAGLGAQAKDSSGNGGELDVLAVQELTHWDERGWWRLHELADSLGMTALPPVTSHVGDGRNHLAILCRPGRVQVLRHQDVGRGAFHHGLARAHLAVEGHEFTVLATHLAWTDGDTRLREARWMTDNAGTFPGQPPRAVLLGDLNCLAQQDPEPDWTNVPRNMHPRYRTVHADGSFGPADRRALRVLLNSGWTDPQTVVREPRKATVGYWYKNEPTPLHLDHALTAGDFRPLSYVTHDTPEARAASDHLPITLTTAIGATA